MSRAKRVWNSLSPGGDSHGQRRFLVPSLLSRAVTSRAHSPLGFAPFLGAELSNPGLKRDQQMLEGWQSTEDETMWFQHPDTGRAAGIPLFMFPDVSIKQGVIKHYSNWVIE